MCFVLITISLQNVKETALAWKKEAGLLTTFSLMLSEQKMFDFFKSLLLSEVIMIFHILHSPHNNPIITIRNNRCTQLY